MNQNSSIVFVCEHGAAKSILAAALFNRFASDMGLDLRAIARGTDPDNELSPHTISGLSKDGLYPTELIPQKLAQADIESAQCVIAFGEVPIEYQSVVVERWEEIPAVSESYEAARDVIAERIRRFLDR